MTTAKQGHRYSYCNRPVLALETGETVKVALIHEDRPYPLGEQFTVPAEYLEPVAMRYFHGELPK